jgi:hypothetical protein
MWHNIAEEGFFRWLALTRSVKMVIGECKNYDDDIANPEFDQLLGRFGPNVGEFGLLICRSVKDRKLAIKRCRDAAHAERGTVLVMDDDDVRTLAKMDRSVQWGGAQWNWLTARMNEVVL